MIENNEIHWHCSFVRSLGLKCCLEAKCLQAVLCTVVPWLTLWPHSWSHQALTGWGGFTCSPHICVGSLQVIQPSLHKVKDKTDKEVNVGLIGDFKLLLAVSLNVNLVLI